MGIKLKSLSYSVKQKNLIVKRCIMCIPVSQTASRDIFCLHENCPVLPQTSCRGSFVIPPRIRVLNGKSPACVKLNAPATGHRIGTGSFPVAQKISV